MRAFLLVPINYKNILCTNWLKEIVKRCENLLFSGATLCLGLDKYFCITDATIYRLFCCFGTTFLAASVFISFGWLIGCVPM